MSDKPSNYEPGDELLSAYLDGELSADERAMVEARLATDPAAQQLLHELRSVSQSVQALPTESLGRDLSEEILHHAREAAPTSARSPSKKPIAAPPTSRSIDSMPTIRVFGSRRAWIWASMALAASLLIMIVQSVDKSANKLPPVAARNQEGAQTQSTNEATQSARREKSMSAASQSSSPSPPTVAADGKVQEKHVDALGGAMPAAPAASEPLGVQLDATNGVGPAAGPPASSIAALKTRTEVEGITTESDDASSTLSTLPEQVAADKSTAAPRPTGNLSGPGGAPGMPAEKHKSKSIVRSTAQQFLVVHVVATPDAFRNGSFDRLLADNKIEFVPQPAKKHPLNVSGGSLAKPAESETRSKDLPNKAADIQVSKTEMVLVEAPAPAIESCLADLNKNADDFVSVVVNEGRQSQDRSDTKSTATTSLADSPKNFSRFSRGAVPEEQKDTIDLRKYVYSYDFDKPNDPVANGSPRAGGFGGEGSKSAGASSDASGDKKWYYKNQPAPDIRRARSIAPWGIDNRQSDDVAAATGRASRIQPQSNQSGAEATNRPMSQRKLNEQPEAKSDSQNNNLKVLFVFTPEEAPAPSAPSDNRPK